MQVSSILLILLLIIFDFLLLSIYIREKEKYNRLEKEYITLRTFVRGMSFKTSIDLIKYVSESFFSAHNEDIYISYKNIYMYPGYVQLYKNGRFVGQITEMQLQNDLSELQQVIVNKSVSIYVKDPVFIKDIIILLDVLFQSAMNYDELYSKAGIDGLTGLHNRAAFESYKKEVYPFIIQSGPVSFIMIDVDKFKEFNDKYGHDVGDIVLKRVSGAIVKNIKKSDFAFRYGGDEMGIILKGDKQIAEEVMLRIRDVLKQQNDYKITLSVGIAEAERNESCDHLQGRADQALYRSKEAGRDRISIA